MRPARYAIVTPYWNEARWLLERCIRSVRDQAAPADHIVVADGLPQDWIDAEAVRHIRLDRNHADFGNTPRGVGALLAMAEGYDGIAFLDADNWFEKDHVSRCVQAAATHDWDYVIAQRNLCRPDGSVIAVEDDPIAEHVDTSCFFMLPASYYLLPYMSLMPRELSPICDRVFYAALKAKNLKAGVLTAKTVNYHCLWESVYRRAGEAPPAGAKPDVDWTRLHDWFESLTPEQLQDAYRRSGAQLRFQRSPQPAAAAKAGDTGKAR